MPKRKDRAIVNPPELLSYGVTDPLMGSAHSYLWPSGFSHHLQQTLSQVLFENHRQVPWLANLSKMPRDHCRQNFQKKGMIWADQENILSRLHEKLGKGVLLLYSGPFMKPKDKSSNVSQMNGTSSLISPTTKVVYLSRLNSEWQSVAKFTWAGSTRVWLMGTESLLARLGLTLNMATTVEKIPQWLLMTGKREGKGWSPSWGALQRSSELSRHQSCLSAVSLARTVGRCAVCIMPLISKRNS